MSEIAHNFRVFTLSLSLFLIVKIAQSLNFGSPGGGETGANTVEKYAK